VHDAGMTENEDRYIAALVDLHRGLEHKGPGDAKLTLRLLGRLPPLPAHPRIADLGCGAGAATLLLAQYFGARVRAVDLSPVFIEELKARAVDAGLEPFVEPVCADMAALDWPHATIDLLWSEGAAYILGFEHALRSWRPLLAPGGVAVVSEMSWFADSAPREAMDFWRSAYPGMATESVNVDHAGKAGFAVLFTERLPAAAWWRSYYGPLRERIRDTPVTGVGRVVIRELEREMSLFERYSDHYGYTFYALLASGSDRGRSRA
ncbi:MAG: class I SAM-dependent methyltransferase, partial [Burkholderiales bacterium]